MGFIYLLPLQEEIEIGYTDLALLALGKMRPDGLRQLLRSFKLQGVDVERNSLLIEVAFFAKMDFSGILFHAVRIPPIFSVEPLVYIYS
jgi:hypothetical protein